MSKAVKKVSGAAKRVSGVAKNIASNPTNVGAYADAAKVTADPYGFAGTLSQTAAEKAQAASGVSLSGQPIRPGFQSLLGVDPKTGQYNRLSLAPELSAPEVVGAAGRTALSERALAQGPSKAAQLMLEQQGLEEATNLGQIGKQGAADLAGAQGSIARSGGLRSGVGALMASQNMRDQMMQKQQARRGGLADRLGINLQDDQMKQNLLTGLVGQDLQSQQYNTGNVLGEKRAKDASDLAKYNAEMQAWAANKQGKAIAASAPKGGMFGFLGL
jgi:hypothetical protein